MTITDSRTTAVPHSYLDTTSTAISLTPNPLPSIVYAPVPIDAQRMGAGRPHHFGNARLDESDGAGGLDTVNVMTASELSEFLDTMASHLTRRGIRPSQLNNPKANDAGSVGFHEAGGIDRASTHLLQNSRRVLMAGAYNVAPNMPETDGPVGIALAASVLVSLGKEVTLLTDSLNAPVLRAALAAISPGAERYVRIEIMDERGEAADAKAKALIEARGIDTVFCSEVPARTREGVRRNMRGVPIDDFNAALDSAAIQGHKLGCTVIGVGDGGNEVGMANQSDIPPALDGSVMKSSVPAHYPVTAWNSNLGAALTAMFAAWKAGRMDVVPAAETYRRAILQSMKAGAHDGVTRLQTPSNIAGVDGVSPEVHANLYGQAVSAMARTVPASAVPQVDAPRVFAALMDSSDGGLIAGKNVAAYMKHRYPHVPFQFLYVLDHGNAPYGPKDRGQLIELTGNMLKLAEQHGADVIAMACNTASLNREAADRVKLPVINLVDVTSKSIAAHGGERPCALSTAATAAHPAYPDQVKQLNGRTLAMVGCPLLATMVNEEAHLHHPDEVVEAIDSYVKDIPKDATSVWLCCTHYPELTSMIRESMDRKGLTGVPIIDPMEHQAEALAQIATAMARELSPLERSQVTRATSRITPDVVLSSTPSGDAKTRVERSAARYRPNSTVKATDELAPLRSVRVADSGKGGGVR